MIKNSIIQIESQICDQYNIEAIYLFGSSLRVDFLAEDIDLALLFMDTPNTQDYFNLTALFHIYLLSKYGSEIKFDLSILNLAQALLKYKVFTEGRLIYCKQIDRVACFEIKARRQYQDYSFHSRFYDKALISRVQGGGS